MESSGRQLSKNTKYAIVHALLGKKVRYQAVKYNWLTIAWQLRIYFNDDTAIMINCQSKLSLNKTLQDIFRQSTTIKYLPM